MSVAVSEIVHADRILSLDTPLGKDVLLVEQCSGSEFVSGLFNFQLELLADLHLKKDKSVKPEALLGKAMTISLELGSDARYFNGVVRRFTQGPRKERFAHYHADLVPWMWLLTLKSNCRIYQDLTTPEILKKVFDDLKQQYSDLVVYRDLTTGSYEKWDYCVQYRETDFNFVCRLMEQEGIFYYFEHERGKHTLVFADSNDAFKPCPYQPKARYFQDIGYAEREDTVLQFERADELRPGKYMLRDHHFELPSKSLEKSEPTTKSVGKNSGLVLYDYPGEYELRFNKPSQRIGNVESLGEHMAKLRILEEEATQQSYTGLTYCRDLRAGKTFEISGHGGGLDNKYIIISVRQTMNQSPAYISGEDSVHAYENEIVCIPYSVRFMPRRNTPKPVVQGPHTAVVAVKQGEESWLDKYGRVRVQFHWDREGKSDENSACWVRVAQSWAGNTWGTHYWPRIGQEVVVEFLEGDPDRPLITGSVYNAAQMPPYTLPQYYTRSGVKTRSSKNGGSANYNEIRLEDKKDNEQIFINAEKDMDLRVEHDSREYVMNDRHLLVDGDELEKVKGNKDAQVNGDHKEKVGGDVSMQVGGSRDEKVGMKHALESGQEIHLKAGMKVIMEAGVQLTIKAAGGFVDIGPTGVTIQGTMVLINSGGAAGTGSGSSPKEPKDPDTADDGSKGSKM